MFDNQRLLVEASERSDTQIAVLTRLTIVRLNQLTDLVNSVAHEAGRTKLVDPVTRSDMEELFTAFAALRRRSDFKDHEDRWFTGQSLADLPPEPPAEPRGAQIFGGESHGQAHETSRQDEDRELPPMPAADTAPAQPGDPT